MKNITLAIEDELLERARAYAADRGTTVNALVRAHLREVSDPREARLARAKERLVELSEQSGAEIGPLDWSRDDMHGRTWPREDLDG